MLYQILCNSKPLGIVNSDGSFNGLVARDEMGAIGLCKMLDKVIGEVRYAVIPDPSETNIYKQSNQNYDNIHLPGEGKTIYNMTEYEKRRAEGFSGEE